MGYTHYWYREEELDSDNFSNAIKDIALLLSYTEQQEIDAGYAHAKQIVEVYELNRREINFNGIGEDGHENFRIADVFKDNYNKDELWKFDFCKTARKPYDKYVVACLYIFKYHLGDDIKITSDGDEKDWKEGLQMVQDILGYPYDIGRFKLDKSPPIETFYVPEDRGKRKINK
tara:strand:- start:616 stop:1137 length:522 start_codon:yes stop_codon:yes gene_type:complete